MGLLNDIRKFIEKTVDDVIGGVEDALEQFGIRVRKEPKKVSQCYRLHFRLDYTVSPKEIRFFDSFAEGRFTTKNLDKVYVSDRDGQAPCVLKTHLARPCRDSFHHRNWATLS